MKTRIWVAYLIAGFLDLIDFLVVGLVPILGDIVDIVGIVLLYHFIGTYAFIPVVEFVPVIGDLLPSFVFAVLAYQLNLFRLRKKR